MSNSLTRSLVASALALVLTSSLSACGESSSAEISPVVLQAAEKINKEVALESVPGSDVFADYQVTAEAPATIVYSYKYKKGVDLAFFKKHLEENAGKDLAILAEEIKKQFVSEGVKDIKVRYVYKDADDNVVWESTF